jgi:hypothetical protein
MSVGNILQDLLQKGDGQAAEKQGLEDGKAGSKI